MTYRALLIGNSVFDADAGLHPLNAPVKDVARLHHALVDAETGLFDDAHVRLVIERSCDQMLDELDRYFDSGRSDDLLLLYYSGHGLLDERNRLYLCGRDTRSDRLLRTAVSNVRINEFIAQSLCRRVVIMLDCCSSGMFKGGAVGQQLAGPGRYIVSSTRGTALANDAVTDTGTSLFTEYLVEGLLGEAGDANGDGYIDLREVYDYVRDRLSASTTQVPHCRFDGDAAVSLARVRQPPLLSRTPPPGGRRTSEPTFTLAENAISLRDVYPDEQLRPEVIEVINLSGDQLDLTAHTDDAWVTAMLADNRLTIGLRPDAGSNRAKIVVRDANSGTTQTLRVDAYLHRTAEASSPTSAPARQLPPAQQALARSRGATAPGHSRPTSRRRVSGPAPSAAAGQKSRRSRGGYCRRRHHWGRHCRPRRTLW